MKNNNTYTINMTEDEAIRFYANKIVEDALEECSEFHHDTDINQYEDNGFVKQHKEQIIDRINKDNRVLEVYFDEKYSTINMCFGLDYCPYYYEDYDLSPEDEKEFLRHFENTMLRDLDKVINIRTTRDLIRQYMDTFIENSTMYDDDTKDAIYYCLKEHICNTGFIDKYIDKYEVYVNKNNIKELIEGLENEIDKLYIKQHTDIKMISYYKFLEILNKHNKEIPFEANELGKFVTKENGIYLGINNVNGEMKMQDFDNIEKCLNYLNEDLKHTDNLEDEESEEL